MDVIDVNNLTKIYKLYDNVADRLKESIIPFGKKYSKEFYAINNVSFKMQKGENIGIIGKNGCGKSTLLKMITGILTPTSGTLETKGKISALLELGAGFNPEYTGIKNIYMNGMLMGFTKEEMDNKIDDILKFADIGDFTEQPVKIYSSGMYARLAFAVAINVEPEILIVDEALAVGDMAFQHKCMNKMKKMVENGTSLLFVSHDPGAVKSICNRCIYLENGVIKADGNAGLVTDLYLRDTRTKMYDIKPAFEKLNKTEKINLEETLVQKFEADNDEKIINKPLSIDKPEDTTFDDRVREYRYGSGGALIRDVYMIDKEGQPSNSFNYDEMMTFVIKVESYKELNNLNCCILIKDKNGVDITGTTTFEEKIKLPILKEKDKLSVTFKCANKLKHDMTYSVSATINDTISLYEQEVLDVVDLAYTFKSKYNSNRPVWYSYYQNFDIDYKKSLN